MISQPWQTDSQYLEMTSQGWEMASIFENAPDIFLKNVGKGYACKNCPHGKTNKNKK